MNLFIEKLRANSCKITPQRIAIYEVIKGCNDHPNAEMVFNKLSPEYPTMSLATVYKSLELFAKLNLIKMINLGENSFRYDGNTREHQHILCTRCSKIEDIDSDVFEVLRNKVEILSKYEINEQQLCFYGTCSSCIESFTEEKVPSNF